MKENREVEAAIERLRFCSENVCNHCDLEKDSNKCKESMRKDLVIILDYIDDFKEDCKECSAYHNDLRKENLNIKVNVDDEELQGTVDILREINDTKPNITIRNNENVYVTINNFNETEKEYNVLKGEEE